MSFFVTDGLEHYLVDELLQGRLTAEMGGELADLIKVTIVQNQCRIIMWVLRKNA
jgi:hypothetical protein